MNTNNTSHTVGYWTPVTESLPDDEITVLVWVESLGDATLAYHDSDVLARRGGSGWLMAGGSDIARRVLIGVSHWCSEIHPPNAQAMASADTQTPAPQEND